MSASFSLTASEEKLAKQYKYDIYFFAFVQEKEKEKKEGEKDKPVKLSSKDLIRIYSNIISSITHMWTPGFTESPTPSSPHSNYNGKQQWEESKCLVTLSAKLLNLNAPSAFVDFIVFLDKLKFSSCRFDTQLIFQFIAWTNIFQALLNDLLIRSKV